MLSIVCPVLNCHPVVEKMTLEMIDSVYRNTLGDWELIIVNHGGRLFPCAIDFPRVRIIENEAQLSIAQAFNLGFSLARGDLFCCIHNDILLPWAWNYLLERVASRGDMAFTFVNESTGKCEERGVVKTESWQTSSSCFVFSKNIFQAVNGFDEQFLEMHGEDIDFIKRCEQAGAKLVRCDVEIIHYRGATRSLVHDRGMKAFVGNWNKFYFKHSTGAGENVLLPRISETTEERL